MGKKMIRGFMVVILGPDGSGKSSVIREISRTFAGNPTIKLFHLRPALGRTTTKEDGGLVTDPHKSPPYGLFVSAIKILYFLFDYGVGYFVKVRPLLQLQMVVFFDRYYHDLLIDPRRYRYGGPIWLARLVGKFIPPPDLFILLDAPPEVVQSRKQEVPFTETARQREAYLYFVRSQKNGIVIDASRPLEKVVADVQQKMLIVMAQRTKKSSVGLR